LPKPARNVDAAIRQIEGSGWTLGADGIYQKDGQRLSAPVIVRADTYDRVKFVDLLGLQLRDCGMDLRARPTEWPDVLAMITQWPHVAPGSDQPFVAYFGGWVWGEPDPEESAVWSSRRITSAEHPNGDGANLFGWADERGDTLLDALDSTYDQRERARIFKEFQELLAEEQPNLFAWADSGREVLSAAVRSTAGPLDLTSGNWWWQVEKLYVSPEEP
jgi:peptide/nickel transport system substrate-binding protein